MKTIEAFEQDILLQAPYIQKIKLQKQLSIKKQKNTIFCGSGDSLAAALLAESFSNFRIRAADPLDLLKNRSIIKKNQVYIISISGNTVSNINVAKIAQSATAITLNKNSKLVKICSKYIALNYPNSGVFTSGSIGFITSALTCISLVSKFRLRNVSKLFKNSILFDDFFLQKIMELIVKKR